MAGNKKVVGIGGEKINIERRHFNERCRQNCFQFISFVLSILLSFFLYSSFKTFQNYHHFFFFSFFLIFRFYFVKKVFLSNSFVFFSFGRSASSYFILFASRFIISSFLSILNRFLPLFHFLPVFLPSFLFHFFFLFSPCSPLPFIFPSLLLSSSYLPSFFIFSILCSFFFPVLRLSFFLFLSILSFILLSLLLFSFPLPLSSFFYDF
ncbi:unnamed protein product [Acanthosepion pharaonis]|uniref:Uncharacterized protein n=1 Tax=Acanthosepion pharaonis TaxID=158019 RepID=A0A812DAW4_ACAPH|nr:unnamed protein product [Sepia pharaonis]